MQNWDATGNATHQHSIGFDVEAGVTLTVPHDCTGLHKPSSHPNVDEKILSVYADRWKCYHHMFDIGIQILLGNRECSC